MRMNRSLLNVLTATLLVFGFARPGNADLTTGLVAYYPFDGNANDVSMNHRNGTAYNVTYVPGVKGQAASFNGVNSYIKASSDGLPTAERTVSLWFYANSIRMPRPVFLGYGGGLGCGTSWFMMLSPAPEPYFYLSGHCHSYDLWAPYYKEPIGAWYHLVITTSSGGTKWFVNGENIASNPYFVNNTAVLSGRDLTIGVDVWYQGYGPYTDRNVGYFDGKIAELRIYNRALSQGEVQDLYHQVRPELTVQPAVGGDTGSVSVHINGTGFANGAVVTLAKAGEPEILGNPVTVGSGGFTIDTTFDLTGKARGLWDLIVKNPDSSHASLLGGFTIEQGRAPQLEVMKVGTPAVPGRMLTYYISVKNTGNVDSAPVRIFEFLEPWFTFVSSDPVPTERIKLPDGFPSSAIGTDYDGIIEWGNIGSVSIPASSHKTFAYTVVLDSAFPVGGTVSGTACVNGYDNDLWLKVYEICWDFWLKTCAIMPGELVTSCQYEALHRCLDQANELGHGNCGSHTQESRGSLDPNDMTGPTGVGPERWVSAKDPVQYVISFENAPSATKAATDVTIADSLDPSRFDLTTTAISGINLGTSVYALPNLPLASAPLSTDIDLRPSQNLIVRVTASLNPLTGKVTVLLASIDPATGVTPYDPLIGFLQPGAGGDVFLTVMPKAGLATGKQIQNKASIVFDANAPIDTPVWLNTLDNDAPTSHVLPLAATQMSPSFPVQWTGTDVGAGIQDFTIFVSDTGGPFTPWQKATTAMSASYPGVSGHTYTFFSQSRDRAGNVEVPKTQGETKTQVVQALPGDLNGDGKVDCIDVIIVKASFGKKKGQPGFDPRADTNSDGIVDIRDLTFVSQKLPAGTRCP